MGDFLRGDPLLYFKAYRAIEKGSFCISFECSLMISSRMKSRKLSFNGFFGRPLLRLGTSDLTETTSLFFAS